MSDFEKLINASDLIEWIIETDPDWCVGSVRSIIDHIDKMPSTQPETHDKRTKTHSCDCISRQSAIDAHYEYCNKHPDAGFPVWSLKILENLPSAQPEKRTDKCTETHACDLIDRQAAIEALDKRFDSIPMEQTTEILLLRKDLRELPSAQPDLSGYSDKLWRNAYERGKAEAQQRWIPCSERLPEERQEILATTTDNAWGDVVIIRTYYKEMHKSVIAWMPLPEPYREEGE